MKTFKRFSALLVVTLFFLPMQAQNTEAIAQKIATAFNTQNIELLSQQFSNDVELTLPGGNSYTNKNNVRNMLTQFIRQKQINGYEELHQGEKANRMFVIGSLKAPSGNYRISLFLKIEGNNFVINQIRIE
ncbi:MAG: DUF4783 domain-containing protein [Microbacter sp.]